MRYNSFYYNLNNKSSIFFNEDDVIDYLEINNAFDAR